MDRKGIRLNNKTEKELISNQNEQKLEVYFPQHVIHVKTQIEDNEL